MPSRDVGVALEAAVAKPGASDPRAAGCAARVTMAPAGAKPRVQWPSSSTSPIFYEGAGFTYIRPAATATSGAGAGIGGAAAAGASTQTGGASGTLKISKPSKCAFYDSLHHKAAELRLGAEVQNPASKRADQALVV
jgi:hypothetical protein